MGNTLAGRHRGRESDGHASPQAIGVEESDHQMVTRQHSSSFDDRLRRFDVAGSAHGVCALVISFLSVLKLIEEIRFLGSLRRKLGAIASAFVDGDSGGGSLVPGGGWQPSGKSEQGSGPREQLSLEAAASAAVACASHPGPPLSGPRWSSISGLESVKMLLQEATVLPTLRPDLFQGVRCPPRGILLFGPPGSGKTLLVKAVASESRAAFFPITGSSILSCWYGQSEANVKALFEKARQAQPSVVFIDEVDSLLSRRSGHGGTGDLGGPEKRVTNEFLSYIDGIQTSKSDARVIIIAATNHPWDLDEAALSRFSRRIYVPLPDRAARARLLRAAMTGVTCNISEAQYFALADRCARYSGRDLVAVCREASMQPVRELLQPSLLDGPSETHAAENSCNHNNEVSSSTGSNERNRNTSNCDIGDGGGSHISSGSSQGLCQGTGVASEGQQQRQVKGVSTSMRGEGEAALTPHQARAQQQLSEVVLEALAKGKKVRSVRKELLDWKRRYKGNVTWCDIDATIASASAQLQQQQGQKQENGQGPQQQQQGQKQENGQGPQQQQQQQGQKRLNEQISRLQQGQQQQQQGEQQGHKNKQNGEQQPQEDRQRTSCGDRAGQSYTRNADVTQRVLEIQKPLPKEDVNCQAKGCEHKANGHVTQEYGQAHEGLPTWEGKQQARMCMQSGEVNASAAAPHTCELRNGESDATSPQVEECAAGHGEFFGVQAKARVAQAEPYELAAVEAAGASETSAAAADDAAGTSEQTAGAADVAGASRKTAVTDAGDAAGASEQTAGAAHPAGAPGKTSTAAAGVTAIIKAATTADPAITPNLTAKPPSSNAPQVTSSQAPSTERASSSQAPQATKKQAPSKETHASHTLGEGALDRLLILPVEEVRPVTQKDFEFALCQIMPTECDLTDRFEEYNAQFGSGADNKARDSIRAHKYSHIYL